MRYLLVAAFLFITTLFSYSTVVHAQGMVTYTVDVYATVPGCGDGLIQSGEQCDGANLGGASCRSNGFSEGVLSCSSVCTQVTALCTIKESESVSTRLVPKSSSDGVVTPPDTNVVVAGFAAPATAVILLRDGMQSGVAVADSDGFFQITLSGVTAGDYVFQLIADGGGGIRSLSESFLVTVTPHATTKVSGILLSPQLFEAKRSGEIISLRGVAVPDAMVEIVDVAGTVLQVLSVSAEGQFAGEVTLPQGAIRVRLVMQGAVSAYSDEIVPVYELLSGCNEYVDLTNDCRVNLVDFAMALFAFIYEPLGGLFDYNQDGSLDIVDFSIMAFFWTG
jgi:hypothetical protein